MRSRQVRACLERLFLLEVTSAEHDLPIVPRGDKSIGEPVDGEIEDCPTILVAVRRQIRAAASEAEPQRRARARGRICAFHANSP